jgi:hypothetical protein
MANMLRPMNTAELLDRTFFLYRKHFIIFVAIVAIPNLLPLGFNLATIGLRSSMTLQQTLILTLISAIIYLLSISTSQAATIVAVSEVHLERPVRIGSAFLRAKECLVEIVVIAIFMGIGILLGAILLIIPGILLALAWSLAIPAAIIETRGPWDAMRRSWGLTRGNRFRIFIVLLMVTVLSYVVSTLFQIPIIVAIFTLRPRDPRTLPAWVSVYSLIARFVSSSLVVPLSTIATSLIYYDQRVRKEGFDIQFMLSSLKSPENRPAVPKNP